MADEHRVHLDGEENDPVLQRVRATLAPLPAADPMAVARVLNAVHARRPPARRGLPALLDWLRASPRRMAMSSTVVAMALVAIVLVPRAARRNELPSTITTPAVASSGRALDSSAGGAGVQQAAARVNPEGAVPVQFTLDLPAASSVAVVGDFNEWSTTAAPMQQLPGSAVWTATLVLSPGRHVYAFVVDGKTWMADPRAPRAADSDFGKPGSVLLVTPR